MCKKLLYSFKIIGLIIFASVLFKNFVVEIYEVPSDSMIPTLQENDYIAVSKFSYRIATPMYIPFTKISIPQIMTTGLMSVKRGDIAVFNLPLFVKGKKKVRSVNLLKRCVGLPGDTIENKDGKFVIKNGATFYESEIIPAIFFTTKNIIIRIPSKGDTILLHEGITPILQDVILNEGHTFEIQKEGCILIDGKESALYIVNNNYYFMCGDNKPRSIDSRSWGFLPENNLIGRALTIVWSIEGNSVGWQKGIRWERIGIYL